MKILIVDDEQLARERLVDLIEEIDPAHTLKQASNGKEAIEAQVEFQPDLLLLDIRMPVMDGLETARHLCKLEQPPVIVFTTAYCDHALEAFDADAIDYLLKPIKRERLQLALEKALALQQGRTIQPGMKMESSTRTHLSAKTALGLKIIPVHEIHYFKAEQKYVCGVYAGGELILDDTLKSLEGEFAEHFVRIHRNTLVAKAEIQALERGAEGNAMIKLKNREDVLAVSRRHLSQVKQLLKR